MKNKTTLLLLIILTLSLVGCNDNDKSKYTKTSTTESGSETTTVTRSTLDSESPYIPLDDEFVKVTSYIPSIFIDLKYATIDNFTGEKIYNFTDAYLRYGTVKKLMNAQKELNSFGFSIKIWDSYRPLEAQYKLWEVVPNPKYVANPNKGPSGHNLGNCIDITLVNLDGSEIEMPTKFDDFSILADRDYSDVSEIGAANAIFMEKIMLNNGFTGYYGEWWDYTDTDDYSYVEFLP